MQYHPSLKRREFLAAAATFSLSSLVCRGPATAGAAGVPTDDPTARMRLAWTERVKWDHVVDVSKVPGANWNERIDRAQEALVQQGGGVVYFPAGVYALKESLWIKDGVILRGADPGRVARATDKRYMPPARFEFPRFRPTFSGGGTPINSAFQGIYVDDPATASNCGVVNVFLNHGHIHLGEAEDHGAGAGRIVFGCLLRAAAVADAKVPDVSVGQKPWQRFTRWHFGAIDVMASENVLVANNRLPESSQENFVMRGYVLKARRPKNGKTTVEYDVVFDYDNRAGIRVQPGCIGAPGGEEPSGTPKSHPWGFRKGFVIRDNYIFCTGRSAIKFTGDGTRCLGNVIRFPRDVWRQTNTGVQETSGSSTNDNRAVEMRGWRWHVERNDYVVWRNYSADHKYYINDGEGLMHENHCNAHLVDSKLIGNRGNAYLAMYKTGGIDGLLIEDNDIRVDRGVAIMADADHRPTRRGACRNCTIANNTTVGGIRIAGSPAANNVVKGNRSVGGPAEIRNIADAAIKDNQGYRVVEGFRESRRKKT